MEELAEVCQCERETGCTTEGRYHLCFHRNHAHPIPARGLPGPVSLDCAEQALIPDCAPIHPRSCFVGWNTERAGTGRMYAPGQVIHIGGRELHLYAQWIPCLAYTRFTARQRE